MNEFNECVHEVFSAAGDIIIKSMMSFLSPRKRSEAEIHVEDKAIF